MLIEPVITVTGAPGHEMSGHSTPGMGTILLARAVNEGLTALSRVLASTLAGSPPAAADLALLYQAINEGSTAADSAGTDIATRIDTALRLSGQIAGILRDAPAVAAPLSRIVDSLLAGDAPRTGDVASLTWAAGRVASRVVALVDSLWSAARSIRAIIASSTGGPVTIVDALLQRVGLKLNRDAFDVMGLFQGGMGNVRDPAYGYFPSCATPGSPNPAADPFDPAHENPSTCSNTVQVGGECWLSGTPNYGTYGIMMRLCSDWTSDAATPPDMRRVNFAFSRNATLFFARGYKSLNADNPRMPGDWAMATFDGGPGGRVSGGNRPRCAPTCARPYGRPGAFDYVWEPVRPRSGVTWG